MNRPNPITIVAVCIVALAILAFTINDQLANKKTKLTSLKSKTVSVEPFVAYNPPHGKPGHRHDLPDGAPLPNSISNASTSTNNNATLNTIPVPSANISAASASINPPHGQAGHVCGIAVGAPLDSASVAKEAKTAAPPANTTGLNPAHGQPGHKCDIAVGAPLNSTPVKTTSAKTNTTTVANGLNPAHGKPGHRCDVAVGAPLNSATKTATTSAPTTTKLNSSVSPSYNFPNKDSSSSPTSATPQFEYDSTGAPLNPAHGKPGHDCSIAVGKPLKKK